MTEKPTESVKMKDRPADLLPRERLINESARSLSVAELLAILLRTGSREQDVLALSQEILIQSGGVEGLLRQNMQSLCAINGIGQTKACTLLAAIELGHRIAHAYQKEKLSVSSAEQAADIVRAMMRFNEQEAFFVLYLDAKNCVIESRELFVGTVNGANVHPRDIFREAVRLNAVGFIVAHNHPSGDVTPSREDRLLTKRLQEAAKIIDIHLIDHIIVATSYDRKYLSFRDHNYLD